MSTFFFSHLFFGHDASHGGGGGARREHGMGAGGAAACGENSDGGTRGQRAGAGDAARGCRGYEEGDCISLEAIVL